MSETHTQKGQQIIDQMLLDLGLESEYVNILRNIANIITKRWMEKVIPRV